MKYISIGLITIFLTITVIAQDSCSAFITDALTTLDNICETTGRNELCYGNMLVSVTTISGDKVDFSEPGKIMPILDISSIRTSPFAEPNQWGIALMRIQANIPDTLPGQNVTFLLFGDVSLSNAGSASTNLAANTTNNINIRNDPSTNYAVVGSLQANTELELVGRNVTGDWVYFVINDTSGWLFASLLQIEGDVMVLDVVADDFTGSPTVAPMQAVYFSSGIGESTCTEAPKDGILIQTPEYEQAIRLIINDVEIRLGSTVYLQAQAGNIMTVNVLEGSAIVTANDETVNVPEGAVTTIEIDANLHAVSSPSEPMSYITEDIASAPVSILEEQIEIAEPATEEEIQQANQGIVGTWVTSSPLMGSMTLTIVSIDANNYHIEYTTTTSHPEGTCQGSGVISTFEGVLTGNILTSEEWVLECNGESYIGMNIASWIYNPSTDTIFIEDLEFRRQ